MQKLSCTRIILQLRLISDTSSVCTFPCPLLSPSSRRPARRTLRHPYHSRIIHHRQKAQTHWQLILRHPLRLCNHMFAVLAGQTLNLLREGSLPRIQVRWQVCCKPRAALDSVRPPRNCGSSAETDRIFCPVLSGTASFHFAAVVPFLQTSYRKP